MLKLTLYFQTSMPQSTIHGAKEEITDEKTENETSDQPEEEYGFMEPMTLDSEDEDQVENVPKTNPDEVKIEVKEDKNPQVLGFPTGQNFLVLRTKGQ